MARAGNKMEKNTGLLDKYYDQVPRNTAMDKSVLHGTFYAKPRYLKLEDGQLLYSIL